MLLKSFCINTSLVILFFGVSHAQTYQTTRVLQAPKIDGHLDDQVWQNRPLATNFTTWQPHFGKTPKLKTEVKVVYDDQAIYVAAKLYETAVDSVLKEIGNRDNSNLNADFFQVFFDTYHDKTNSQTFRVYASETIMDVKESRTRWDIEWDPVWDKAVGFFEDHWTVEMKIPYSALRFPNSNVQTWGLNFDRVVRRHRERYSWAPINPEVDGFVNQFGKMEGIENIKAPLRLALYPYASVYRQRDREDKASPAQNSTSWRGGMDLKYGLNEAFTLDATIVPDFGQVKSDEIILNLSPFETHFQEKREFFQEGIDLFDKGDMFYTRRIGGRNFGYFQAFDSLRAGESFKEHPLESQLLNATKISGRTKSKLGLGVLNAIVDRSFAEVEDSLGEIRSVLTNPLTNYNAFVLDQSLEHGSSLHFLNTNVQRKAGLRNANASRFGTDLYHPNGKWRLRASVTVSSVNERATRNSFYQNSLGFSYAGLVEKIDGNMRHSLSHSASNEKYDVNDMGFSAGQGRQSYNWTSYFQNPTPSKRLNFRNVSFASSVDRWQVNGQFLKWLVGSYGRLTTKEFHSAGFTVWLIPVDEYDPFESRLSGRFFKRPPHINPQFWFSSDYRRKLALDFSTWADFSFREEKKSVGYNISPRWRISDRCLLIARNNASFFANDRGFQKMGTENPIFALRDRIVVTNELETSYNFSPEMSLSLFFRDYWSTANVEGLLELQSDGDLEALNDSNPAENNFSFHANTLDLQFHWEFLPGSLVTMVYKNRISGAVANYQNHYFRSLNELSDLASQQSLSLKVTYYLDAGTLLN